MVKKKTEFDPEAAFKSIIKVGTEKQRQTEEREHEIDV